MGENRNEPSRIAGKMNWRDRLAFWSIVGTVLIFAGILGLASICDPLPIAKRNFLAVAHWFDPVFFQYNLLMVMLAVLVVPIVTLSYVRTMTGRKERRLYREIPVARRGEIRERLESRISFNAYLGSVLLTTTVVLLGASIILLFKPVPSAKFSGVDFSLGANVLMMGPFIELFGIDLQAYYIHLTRSLTAFQFGFLGAYMYFIGALARAYFTLDLTPHTFVDGTIRMMGASVLALVISFFPPIHGNVKATPTTVSAAAFPSARTADRQVVSPDKANPPAAKDDKAPGLSVSSGPPGAMVGEQSEGELEWNVSLLPIISFIFGFFPKWALLALQRITLRTVRFITPDNYRALPLSMLAGMSYAHELRLEREGFDNIENFSTADPVSLAVRTGFGYPQLAQWVSEAWLATHLREDYPEFVRCTGVTSRDELQQFLSNWDVARGDAVEQLAKGMQDSATSQRMMVKLAALGTLLGVMAS
jgi:hypothetical protein